MPIPLRILILEDNAADTELVLHELRHAEFDPDWQRVDSKADFLAALNPAFDAIIADYSLPQFDGLRALKLVQERHLDIPFILVSGTIGEEVAVDAMKQGAADYLLKDRLARLGPAVARALEQKQLREAKRIADQAVQDSENRFRALIENSSDAIALVGLDGTILYASPPVTRMLGYEIDEYVGQIAFEFIHPDDLQSAEEIFGRILQQPGISVTAQARERHKDGSWRWLEGVATNLLDEPSVRAIVVNFRDVTERKRAEEEIKRRVAELEAVNKISTALRTAQSVSAVLPALLDETLDMLDADTGAIWLYDAVHGKLRETVARGWFTQTVEPPLRLREDIGGPVFSTPQGVSVSRWGTQPADPADPAGDWRSATGEPYISREFASDSLTRESARLQIPAGWGGACVPIRSADEIVGVLFVSVELPRELTPSEVRLLTTLAEMAGNTIHRMRLHESLEEAYETTLEGWSRALDLRDKETEGHTRRVAELTLRLARAMGMNESELVHVRRGALLHDIGKMGVADRILNKHAALTLEEWKIMRMHPTYAYQLLKQIEFLLPALDIPYSHHEKWDGTGYPRGLKGDEIPLAARIFAIVDVWDALRSERPYRPGWSEKRALQYIREQAGKHFDPKVAARFLQIISAEHETLQADKRRVWQTKRGKRRRTV